MSGILDVGADLSRIWDCEAEPTVTLDCLMPTGILIPLTVYKSTTLAAIKERLWDEARKYPLSSTLQDRESYVFVCVNDCAEQEELDDEGKSIGDVKPFLAMLKVKFREGEEGRTSEKAHNTRISHLIGKGIHEFDALKDNEVQDFRQKMKRKCQAIAVERTATGSDGIAQILLHCPPDMCEGDLSEAGKAMLLSYDSHGCKVLFSVTIRLGDETGKLVNCRFLMPYDSFADELISQVLIKKRENFRQAVNLRADDYLLKVCGREEYLVSAPHQERPLHQFQYVRSRIMKGEIPQLVLLDREVFERAAPRVRHDVPQPMPRPAPRPKPSSRKKELCLWDVAQNYYLTIGSAYKVNLEDNTSVSLKMAIFHGGDTLCDIVETSEIVVKGNEAHFNEKLVLGVAVYDLPRMAKLSVVMYARKGSSGGSGGKSKNKKQRTEVLMRVACANLMAFDYKGVLNRGERTLHMWPAEAVCFDENILNPNDAVLSNPHVESATSIVMRLADYGIDSNIIITFPTFERVLECAAQHRAHTSGELVTTASSEQELEQLALILQRDPLQSFHEQEKETVWQAREDIRDHFPECLPKLLTCVHWNSHVAVSEMYALLQIWPELSFDVALELLDFMYADRRVRQFAIQCLRKCMSDSELCRYLLQLVQALKFESYLESELLSFLLERALYNRRIGHSFFWLLRAEMHRPSASLRFGLILEAYFHGCKDHMKLLRKQLDALAKLQAINNLVKADQYKKVRERGIADMQSILAEPAYLDSLSDLASPLDPAFKLARLRNEKCKYMDSKMKPLWLVWSNADPVGCDICLIFKNGDDLRQDMLTLQMIAIMESIWTSAGLDLRMNPYGCVCTGRRAGLIEVVQESNTIANIQKMSAGALQSAFRRESLFQWLQEHNPNPTSLKKAIEEFTLSCAGYCVATYVLGIGDRHSDNIMLKTSGQLFHIDFGHFLGNFKSKFGVKRERVPFVLTNDFVYIINGGKADGKDGKDFQKFKVLCEDAFMLLRQRGNLLISLFMMMISTGIPELQSVADIKYLQETLVLHLSKEDALKHFESKFREALKNSWKTSINWAMHNVARDNA